MLAKMRRCGGERRRVGGRGPSLPQKKRFGEGDRGGHQNGASFKARAKQGKALFQASCMPTLCTFAFEVQKLQGHQFSFVLLKRKEENPGKRFFFLRKRRALNRLIFLATAALYDTLPPPFSRRSRRLHLDP